MEQEKKKTIFSATQPSGKITLGNYLGALRNYRPAGGLQCPVLRGGCTRHHRPPGPGGPAPPDPGAVRPVYCLRPGPGKEHHLHPVPRPPARRAGLDPQLLHHVRRAEPDDPFKDKSATHADNVNAGLFTYPSLMAADILLYQTDLVPVGEDQRQHVELTRNIAQRFNGIYGDVFAMPEAYIPKVAARVMSLSEPDKKMSKSNPNENSYILVMDKPEVILRKFKRAVTDSEGGIYRSPDKPGVSNLIEIYAAVTGKTPEAVEQEFSGQGYGTFKPAVGEAVAETLRPIREETERLLADKGI